MQIEPSGMRAEMFPAVPSTRPLRSMALAVLRTSSFMAYRPQLCRLRRRSAPSRRCRASLGTAGSLEYLGVHDVERAFALDQAAEVVGDEPGVVGLGVEGRPPDVGSEHHVRHRR